MEVKTGNSRKQTAATTSQQDAAPAAGNRRVRIQDVAESLGVSLGTVSAVLNGNGRTSQQTRKRVQEEIQRLGYRPDFHASNLARRESRLLGVVVSNLQNPFFAETAQAIEEEAERHGYRITLMATNFSPQKLRGAMEQVLKSRVAGIAVMTSEHDEAARRLVLASGVPAVFLDLAKAESNVATLRIDSRGGMRAAVEHLLDLGHRRLLFVRNSQQAGGRPLVSHTLRDQGFAAAVRANASRALTFDVVDVSGPAAEAGENAVVSSFQRRRWSAVITVTDNVALGVYRGLASLGLRIPEDVSVVGFDNTYFSRFLNPPLTTVDVPREEMSRLVVQGLLDSRPGQVLHLPTTLVVRSSSATAPAAPKRKRTV